MVRNFMFILAMTAFFRVNIFHKLQWHLSHSVNHRHMLHITICSNNLLAFTVFYSDLSVNLCYKMHIHFSGFGILILCPIFVS